MHESGKVLRHVHASTCFRIGSKLRCMRSTRREIESSNENDFEVRQNRRVHACDNVSDGAGRQTSHLSRYQWIRTGDLLSQEQTHHRPSHTILND